MEGAGVHVTCTGWGAAGGVAAGVAVAGADDGAGGEPAAPEGAGLACASARSEGADETGSEAAGFSTSGCTCGLTSNVMVGTAGTGGSAPEAELHGTGIGGAMAFAGGARGGSLLRGSWWLHRIR